MDAFTLVAKLTLNKEEFTSGLAQAGQEAASGAGTSGFSAWGVAAGNLATQAFLKIWRGGIDFAKSVISTGMDFDSMMGQVQAVSSLTADQFDSVRQKAQDLGKTTKFTAEEAAQGFYYMGLAGWDFESMMKGIGPVLDLAAASGENLGTVSDIVTDAMTAMGVPIDEAAHFVDVLAAASANSNTTVGMMGEAFKYVATSAGILGYSIDDVGAALGFMANSGIKGSQAGMTLRMMLSSLINPSDDAEKAMKKYGISLTNADGSVKPLMQLMQELRGILLNSGFDPAGSDVANYQKRLEELNQQLAAGTISQDEYNASLKQMNKAGGNAGFLEDLSDIFGVRGLNGVLAIMNATDEDFKNLTGSIQNSEGAAGKMAGTMLDNLKGDITLFNSALDGLKLMISDEYVEKIRTFVSTLTEEVGKLSDVFDQTGLAGMLNSLADWLVNGIADALSNPDFTGEGAQGFGKALGDFVGNLISTLVTSAPEILSGLFTAGMNLAGGLVEGLFSGLFGTGADSIPGYIQQAQDEEAKAIADAEATSAKAQGIVGYMQSLVDKYGQAATETEEWKSALEQLKTLMPEVAEAAAGSTEDMETYISNLKGVIMQQKEITKAKAREKTVQGYYDRWSEKQAEYEDTRLKAEISRGTAEGARKSLIEKVQNYEPGYTGKGANGDYLNIDDIAAAAYDYYRDNKQEQANIAALVKSFKENMKSAEQGESKLPTLQQEAAALESELNLAVQAAQALNAEVGQMKDKTVTITTNFVTNRSDGSQPVAFGQAKGDWNVPYDDYPSLLHRGEMVLTASQARKYREGEENGTGGMSPTEFAMAMRAVMGDMGVYIGKERAGNLLTKQISKNMAREARGRRYSAV